MVHAENCANEPPYQLVAYTTQLRGYKLAILQIITCNKDKKRIQSVSMSSTSDTAD